MGTHRASPFRSRLEEVQYRQEAAQAWKSGRRPQAPEAYVASRVKEEQLRTPVERVARTPRETAKTVGAKLQLVHEKLYEEARGINPELTPAEFAAELREKWQADLEAAGRGEAPGHLVPEIEAISPGLVREALEHRQSVSARAVDVPAILHERGVFDVVKRFTEAAPLRGEQQDRIRRAFAAAALDEDEGVATRRVIQALGEIDAKRLDLAFGTDDEAAALRLAELVNTPVERDEQEKPYTPEEREHERLVALPEGELEKELDAKVQEAFKPPAVPDDGSEIPTIADLVGARVDEIELELDRTLARGEVRP